MTTHPAIHAYNAASLRCRDSTASTLMLLVPTQEVSLQSYAQTRLLMTTSCYVNRHCWHLVSPAGT